jgi:hypothetical protein
MRFITLLLCLSLALAAGCATDTSTPEISDLTATPSTMKVGQQATVTGTFHFDDADGDLEQLNGEITMPDGTKQALRNTDVTGIGAMTTGTLSWAMIVVPPAAGSYKLELWVTDADGHESNRLETTATATP